MTTDEVAEPGPPSVDGNSNEKKALGQDTNDSTSTVSTGEDRKFARIRDNEYARSIWRFITWTPKRCRWDPESPPQFSMGLNVLFAFAGTFTVANLYYNHPILNILAEEFNVTNEKASQVPTVMQAGYAAGLLFLCPLGDIFRRRAFVLILVFFTATMWIGLCLTKSFSAFLALSFITALSTVTPQLMLPLVGDLAPLHRRATALSIVVSGLLLGMLIARLLSGILTQYTSWRSIYWFSLGVQYLILVLLFLFMPDYPSTNPGGLNYFMMLWSIVKMLFKYPLLVQACLVGFCVSSIFTSYWTTLTFLLSSPPYNYNSVTIGLFALIGIGAMCFGPPYSKAIIDRFVPLFSVILGLLYCMTGVIIGTYIGKFTVAGPIIQAFAIDLGLQTSQIANRSAIYTIAPLARNRVNTAYMVSVFCGQLMGTAVGNKLYARGGWVASGSCSVGFVGVALLVCFARAPWNPGWIGWKGGWNVRRRDLGPRTAPQEPAIEQALDEVAAEEGQEGVVAEDERMIDGEEKARRQDEEKRQG
ncbi:related to dityrosine transporter [Phialocephala subalpina]|uniref:Related to dityrosine transporter n=1 Tax=Phialocephala subalpina TaxID=576137 RepID=A0A1L7X746_9HELO|nr:related to dityrosine transporter [Phialocephala subalpina]